MIEATRDFVCIRIDSYESEEAQKIVRSHLNGRFENTAFCILAPDGKTRLSSSHRGPNQALGHNLVGALNEFAAKYKVKNSPKEATVPDFPNAKLAVNVASADQRLLIQIATPKNEREKVLNSFKALANDPEIIGRFHYDYEEAKETVLLLTQPDEFGQSVEVLAKLPLDAPIAKLKKIMLEKNEEFAKTTKKKVYSEHVREGRKRQIDWKMPMEYGEDRDGDGKIDQRGGRGRRGPGQGRPRRR